MKKIGDGVATTLDFGHGFAEFALAKKNGGFGARAHHEHIRPELLHAPGKFFPIGVLGDKSEKIEITLRVAHHAREIVDLKQAQIAMVILDAFLLELGALFRR